MKTNPVVIIPLYKESLTDSENESIKQCFKILNSFPVVFVAPMGLSKNKFHRFINKDNVGWIIFEDKYFSSIDGYNKLMLSKKFYELFKKFSHILIYQTDAWIFRDELTDWCEKKNDYVGSPIFDLKNDLIPTGGNGGFSLRKTKSCIKTLSRFKIMDDPREVFSYFKKFHSGIRLWIRLPLIVLRMLGYKNNSFYYIRNFGANEDVFWSTKAHLINKNFKPAPVEEELTFAFDKYPSLLFEMNGKKLPFGCHAWEKHEPDFWKQYIKNYE